MEMFPMKADILDLSKYEILEDALNRNGFRKLNITPVSPVVICSNCNETEEIVKKDLTRHTVYDIFSKEPIEVVVVRQRYRCNACGCTFTSTGDPYPPKSHVTQEFGAFLSQKMLQDTSLTYTAVKDLYGISQTYISEALGLYAKEMDKLIISMQECYRLIFYPFEYEKKIRCCICGTDDGDRNVILGILDDYSIESIKSFINTKVTNASEIMTVFCALIPGVVGMLHNVLPDSEIVINPISIQRKIKTISVDTGDGFYNAKIGLLNKLKELMEKQYENYTEFCNAYNQWKCAIPIELQPVLSEFVADISTCLQECYNASQYEENEFDISTVMSVISAFRKNNVPYGIMCLRILFVNPYVLSQVKASQYGNYMREAYRLKTFGIENYAIDIKMLQQWFPDIEYTI